MSTYCRAACALMGFRGWVAAGALLLLLTGAPAIAAPKPFIFCDGFIPPDKLMDGMTPTGARALLGATGGYGVRNKVDLGAVGVEACDAALADPTLPTGSWMRRASLYNARAIHDLVANDPTSALRDLEQSEALAPDPADPFYRRSLGLNTRLIRASALRMMGQDAEATAAAMDAWRSRPFNRQVAYAALASLGQNAPRADTMDISLRFAQLVPDLASPRFEQAFVQSSSASDDNYRTQLPYWDGAQIFMAQLNTETATRAPKNVPWKRPFLAMKNSIDGMSVDGYLVTDHPDTGSISVEYRSPRATMSMVEEAALLRAAEIALAAGKYGFAIIKRKDTSVSLTYTYMAMAMSSEPLSEVTVLDIVLSDREVPASETRFKSWRVLNAAEIRASLEPLYPQVVASGKH